METSPSFASPRIGMTGIALRDNAVLLVLRANAPARGTWAFPGGRLEASETVEEGVRRELREECGLRVDVGPCLDVTEYVQRDTEGTPICLWLLHHHLVRVAGGRLRAGDDAEAARWVHLGAVAALPHSPDVPRLALAARHHPWLRSEPDLT